MPILAIERRASEKMLNKMLNSKFLRYFVFLSIIFLLFQYSSFTHNINGKITDLNVIVDPNLAGINATYSIEFSIENDLALFDWICVRFPEETQFPDLPEDELEYNKALVLMADDIIVDSISLIERKSMPYIVFDKREFRFLNPIDILKAGIKHTIIFKKGCGIVNPREAGFYKLKINTQRDSEIKESNAYEIIKDISSAEVSEKIRIIMEIGNKTVNVNGVRKTLDVAPYLKEGRTMVPLRFIVEELKGEIKWNNDTKTVNLIFDNPEYLKRVKETTEKFTVWISNPTKSSQTAILIYLPIKIDNNCFIRGSINFPDGTNAGVFEPNKFLPEEYLKKIMLNGKSILELKPPNTEKFGFINFGKENNPLIRFYFSTKEPVDELKLYLPSDLGMKFEKTGTFNILLKILTVESNDNWYETPFLESQKFTIFENLP